MKRYEHYMYCCQRMLEYVDPNEPDEETFVAPERLQNHRPLPPKDTRSFCVVCKLEIGASLGGKGLGRKGMAQHVATCSACGSTAHNVI